MDLPTIQTTRGSTNAATLFVALANPNPEAVYYIKAFKTAAIAQPDGGEQQVSATIGNGTAADPFTFTWRYSAAGTPPAQRWFVVEADADGSGPAKRAASTLSGPVTLGKLESSICHVCMSIGFECLHPFTSAVAAG